MSTLTNTEQKETLNVLFLLSHFLITKYCGGQVTVSHEEWAAMRDKTVSLQKPVINADRSITVTADPIE